jgi:hypothetical protein
MGGVTKLAFGWTHWALDATLGEPLGFVPVEIDDAGRVEAIVWGMTYITDTPPGKLIGVVHQNGQDAVEAWCAENPDYIKRYFPS